MSNLVITGASGFLGSEVIRQLDPECDYDAIYVLSRSGIELKHPNAKLKVCAGNLLDPKICEMLAQQPTVLIHLASAVEGSYADQYMNSVVATRNLLDALVKEGTLEYLFHCSSLGVYDCSKPHNGLIDESCDVDPEPHLRDPYTCAKIAQEALVREYAANNNWPVAIGRPAVIYGKGSPGGPSRIGLGMGNWFFRIGGSRLLPLVSVENCAAAIIHLTNNRLEGTFNLIDSTKIDSKQYMTRYKQVRPEIKSIRLPYFLVRQLSKVVRFYAKKSVNQIPPVLTPKKVANSWLPHVYSNKKLSDTNFSETKSPQTTLQEHFDALVSTGIDTTGAVDH